MSSWYSISICLASGEEVFNGNFVVDNTTNLITAFYETINGSTNFNNNILFQTGTNSLVQSEKYLDFTLYQTNTRYAAGVLNYDNAFMSNWLQFDAYGVIINSMSKYPNYKFINLCALNINDESISNNGYAYSLLVDDGFNCKFIIKPFSGPQCFNQGTKILILNKN
jgi:hypothetical protein